MSLLFGICIVLGILCLLYYGLITIYAGIGTAFAGFWIFAGLGLLLLGCILKYMLNHNIKLPSILNYIVTAAVAIGLCIFILVEGTIIYYSNQDAEAGADYAIVLGAQVRGTTITKSLKKRLDTALEYLEDNPQTQVIVSGGQGPGEDITEAEAMRIYLEEGGIAPERIIKEESSTNTAENIRYSKLLMEGEAPDLVIVTNGFHVFRAISIARKQGLPQAQGLAAPSDQILTLNYYIREAAGVLKDFLVGNI
ncbi:MAG TPA: YdcF family protein [Clostridiales bacterium]|nr:YdcF family protein [Clostridiales bacterium]